MVEKRQKILMWSSFMLLTVLSLVGVYFGFVMTSIIPMALNDSSPNFSQLADNDRCSIYREAQSLITPGGFRDAGLDIIVGIAGRV